MFDEAAAAYRRATELRPTFGERTNNLASVLWSQGRLDEALASVRQALACNADFAEAYANLGNILNDQGQLDEAAASYRRAIALKPDLAAAYEQPGQCLEVARPLEEAVACYRRASGCSRRCLRYIATCFIRCISAPVTMPPPSMQNISGGTNNMHSIWRRSPSHTRIIALRTGCYGSATSRRTSTNTPCRCLHCRCCASTIAPV